MARPPRIDYPGAFHHVMHRGARRAPIFARPDDCVLLLDTLGDAVDRFGVEVHGYSLMPNHYHLVLRSIEGELSRFMQFLNGAYTRRLNRRHRWDGPVFRGRFRSQLVERPRHLRYLLPYLHLNPVRANLVRRPEDECWTSHRAYLGVVDAPKWLTTRYFTRLLGGRPGIVSVVTGLHGGRVRWPARFDLDSGFYVGESDTDEPPSSGPAPAPPNRSLQGAPRAVLSKAAAIAGVSVASLLEVRRGPGANPARRFAAWALVRHGGLTHLEAGRHLEMTETATSKVVARAARPAASSPLGAWMKRW